MVLLVCKCFVSSPIVEVTLFPPPASPEDDVSKRHKAQFLRRKLELTANRCPCCIWAGNESRPAWAELTFQATIRAILFSVNKLWWSRGRGLGHMWASSLLTVSPPAPTSACQNSASKRHWEALRADAADLLPRLLGWPLKRLFCLCPPQASMAAWLDWSDSLCDPPKVLHPHFPAQRCH